MKITVLGAAGSVGRRVMAEALARGHEVTPVFRLAPQADTGVNRGRVANVANSEQVAMVSEGQDVVVNATRPASGREQEINANTQGLITGVTGSGARLLVVGGAASLVVPGSGGKTVMEDARYLAPALRHIGQSSLEQYRICQSVTQLDWAYLSPPADLFPGARTGSYRLGRDELLLDEQGRSRISIEDLAVALLDEIERPAHHQQRFTVAY